MVMTGEIGVNGSLIAVWGARRVSRVPADTNSYECEVRPDGVDSPIRHHHRFTIEHDYEDGPLALASKVLAEAARLEAMDGRAIAAPPRRRTRKGSW